MLFRYRNIICCRTKKFDRQISTFGVKVASAKRKSLALPYMIASRLFYFASQKYPFFGVDIARFFILYLQKIVALPAFIGYRYILYGRLITWSGIVTYLYAAQRNLLITLLPLPKPVRTHFTYITIYSGYVFIFSCEISLVKCSLLARWISFSFVRDGAQL